MQFHFDRDLVEELERAADGALVDRASWDDVLQRARASGRGRPRGGVNRSGKKRATLLAAAVVVAVVAALPALGVAHRLWSIGEGRELPPASVSQRDQRSLRALATGKALTDARTNRKVRNAGIVDADVRELASRRQWTFYVLLLPNGDRCYATGRSTASRFGIVICDADAFPARGKPVLDMSVFKAAPKADDAVEVEVFAGFAADGVATVALETEDGLVVARTRVLSNVYLRETDVPTVSLRAIVAFDTEGHRLWRSCLTVSPCAG